MTMVNNNTTLEKFECANKTIIKNTENKESRIHNPHHLYNEAGR